MTPATSVKPYALGLISGTSMDGIDAAIIAVESGTLIDGLTMQYSSDLKIMLQKFLSTEVFNFDNLTKLHRKIGLEFAEAALAIRNKCGIRMEDIAVIGSHGQTVAHRISVDNPYTIQLGCAHTIAEKTKSWVVADFRTRDLILGGQGAPLAPLFHALLFKNQGYPLIVINLGGIANITVLANSKQMHGYDIGPANCLLDAWIQRHQGKNFDEKGEWAAKGKILSEVLAACLSDPYFSQSFPKSIGKEYFSLKWLNQFLPTLYHPVDIQATLLSLTVTLIKNELQKIAFKNAKVIVCGGGVHNLKLMEVLTQELTVLKVKSSIEYKIDPNYIEAQLFAWLGYQAIIGKLINLREITGASKLQRLGVIYFPGIDN